MISLQTRSFLLGKDNEPDGRQDALSVNDTSAMYAVADGVSNSFHPEIISRKLCESFVNLQPGVLPDWEEYVNEELLPMLSNHWNTETKRYLSGLNGRILRHETINFERWRMGASTFCGAYIDVEKELIRYFIIGDSTLFAHGADGRLFELNSSPKSTDESGEEKTDYSNITSAIISDETISGEWMVGELFLDGIDRLALMTDGMAKWYQKMHLKNLDPFEVLWEINDADEFSTFANKVRSEEMEMDDDLAVILIRKIDDTSIVVETLACNEDSGEDVSDKLENKKLEVRKEDMSEVDSEDTGDTVREKESESSAEPMIEKESESGAEPMIEKEFESGAEPMIEKESESGAEPMIEKESESDVESKREEESEGESEMMHEEESKGETIHEKESSDEKDDVGFWKKICKKISEKIKSNGN